MFVQPILRLLAVTVLDANNIALNYAWMKNAMFWENSASLRLAYDFMILRQTSVIISHSRKGYFVSDPESRGEYAKDRSGYDL